MSMLILLALLPMLMFGLMDGADDGDSADAPDPANSIEGTTEGDVLSGTARGDLCCALDGNDYVSGLEGNDELLLAGGNDYGLGGSGNDSIYGGDGGDVAFGGTGNDLLRGGGGNDILVDGIGQDTLWGDLGHDFLNAREDSAGQPDSADSVYGGYGFDTLIGDAGDTLSGGAGMDEFYVIAGNQPVEITDWEAGEPLTVTVPVGLRDSVVTTRDSEDGQDLEVVFDGNVIAILTGKAGFELQANIEIESFLPEQLSGTADDDLLIGGSSNDVMTAFGGNDTIDSDGGNDTVYGGAGSDFVSTGAGNDLYHGYLDGSESAPFATDVDEVFGGAGNDTLIGDGGVSRLFGESGNDYLSGRDFLTDQGATADWLAGGLGLDTLQGDAGDTLTGGSGADTFEVFAVHQSTDAPVTIEDFDPVLDQLVIHLQDAPDQTSPAGQMTFDVDADSNSVTVSIDGVPRLVLNNTHDFNPAWVTVALG